MEGGALLGSTRLLCTYDKKCTTQRDENIDTLSVLAGHRKTDDVPQTLNTTSYIISNSLGARSHKCSVKRDGLSLCSGSCLSRQTGRGACEGHEV